MRSQEDTVVWLCRAVDNVLIKLERDVLPHEQEDYPPPGLKQPRVATVFGLLGPRGSGKTTVLQAFLDKASASDRLLVIRDPIDCSLVPEKIPLLLNVIHRVHADLGARRTAGSRGDPCGRRLDPTEDFERVQEAAEQATAGYHELARDLAVSPSHYGRQASLCTRERFLLPQKVMRWLRTESSAAGGKVVLLALDDVDLARRDFIDSVVGSLLDELHQARLLVLLAADMARLEHLVQPSARSTPERDLHTQRDLLQKVMPYEQRVELLPWEVAERVDFRPEERDRHLGSEGPRALGQLIGGRQLDVRLSATVTHLLPKYPRGLESLYAYFRLVEAQGQELAADGTASSTSGDGRTPDWQKALPSLLARVRGEHELGRLLLRRRLDAWSEVLFWPESPPQLAWADSVKAAEKAALDSFPGLPVLAVGSSLLPLDEAGEDAPLWVELILDAALGSGRMSPGRLLTHMDPAVKRFQGSRIQTSFTHREMRAWLRNPPAAVPALLCWSEWGAPSADRQTISFGCAPLVEALSGERPIWPEASMSYYLETQESLLQRPTARSSAGSKATARDPIAELLGSRQEPGSSVLPSRVRPLLLYADALARAPWALLAAGRSMRGPMFHCGLAAGFTWGSYLRALGVRAERVPADKPYAPFLLSAEHADVNEVLEWDREDLLDGLRELGKLEDLAAFLRTCEPDHRDPSTRDALLQAFTTFHKHEAFRFLLHGEAP
jgi:hypothetical protein